MPTLAKPQLTDSPFRWGPTYGAIYQELSRNRISIFTLLKFYEKHDVLPPRNARRRATRYEKEELRQIASALTEAAVSWHTMPTAVLVATLLRVSKKPGVFFTRDLPAPVERELACNYQRADEPPGTHWPDVWGENISKVTDVEKPTEANIAKAACAAVTAIQERRTLGRNYNAADQILADRLGDIFRRSGQSIRRRNKPIMRNGKLTYVEGGGPFYDFLDLVLKPLQTYLNQRRLGAVTTATIVRIVADDYPPSS